MPYQNSDPKLNDDYWRENLAKRAWRNPDADYDQYRVALEFGAAARSQYDPTIRFDDVASELASDWAAHFASTGVSWDEIKDAVEAAWARADQIIADAIASQGGYDCPPTFLDHGRRTPRNLDEPNI